MNEREHELAKKAITQVRDALLTLTYVDDGWYEDEAQVALDAFEWIESRLLAPVDP